MLQVFLLLQIIFFLLVVFLEERTLKSFDTLFGWPQLGAFGDHAISSCLEEITLILIR
jgi:hypothetical protein